MKFKRRPSSLQKKARRGFRGYPVATINFYGPTCDRASKVAVGIVNSERGEVDALERWFTDATDARSDEAVGFAILDFIKAHNVKTVVMADRIIGCPHEEGIDYPDGRSCPQCPYWAGRDRFTHEMEH
jgi:hypothetical protein